MTTINQPMTDLMAAINNELQHCERILNATFCVAENWIVTDSRHAVVLDVNPDTRCAIFNDYLFGKFVRFTRKNAENVLTKMDNQFEWELIGYADIIKDRREKLTAMRETINKMFN